MWTPKENPNKITILAGITALTVAIHYGYIFDPLFGHVHWLHALHGRFCYIPIVIAASWFGIRGGLYSATVISALVLPYVFGKNFEAHEMVTELVEIIFYYFIGALIGLLVDREFFARKKQQEAELQVERSQKLSLVGQIAAGVAHEIKNPLASIKGAADILVDKRSSELDRHEFGEILQSEVKRINGTVSEFLAFARPKETKLERSDFAMVISSCVRQVTAQAEQAGVRIETEIDDQVIIMGDTDKLHQMVLNLILNAINASSKSGIIRVSLGRTEDNNSKFIVKDEGCGMSNEDLLHAFEPFYSTRPDGTGLGLAIVKSIVDSHQGQIELTSQCGKGTKARVTIPLYQIGEVK